MHCFFVGIVAFLLNHHFLDNWGFCECITDSKKYLHSVWVMPMYSQIWYFWILSKIELYFRYCWFNWFVLKIYKSWSFIVWYDFWNLFCYILWYIKISFKQWICRNDFVNYVLRFYLTWPLFDLVFLKFILNILLPYTRKRSRRVDIAKWIFLF